MTFNTETFLDLLIKTEVLCNAVRHESRSVGFMLVGQKNDKIFLPDANVESVECDCNECSR